MSRRKVDVEAGQKCEITGLEYVASHQPKTAEVMGVR